MKPRILFLLSLLLLSACGQQPARAKHPVTPPVKEYTYRVKATYPHATDAYTQGLLWSEGLLWESTGQEGHSRIQKINLDNNRTEVVARLPKSEFGEGLALLGGELFFLTWQSNTAHIYEAKTGKKLREIRYPGEGWGLTSDGKRLYFSNGSANLYTLNPATFQRERTVTVTYEGRPVDFLNELEWIEGRIWANVYTTDRVMIINPENGVVEGVIDLGGLLSQSDYTAQTDVLNGIAYDREQKRIFVTGKNWPKLFEIELVEK